MGKNWTIESVSKVQRGTDLPNDIYCHVKFAEVSFPVPFYARRDSSDAFRSSMWKRLDSGEFGEVSFPPSDYSTHPKTEEEVEEKTKIQRNDLLLKSDWTQLPDAPITESQKKSWEIYRQALRDISKQQGFPYEINWPSKP